MLRKIWMCINGAVTLWGFGSIIVVVLNAIGWLPGYEIVYKKRTEITPVASVYPGQRIRLRAEFPDAVRQSDIQSVTWRLRYSSGKEYDHLPQGDSMDVTLLPDLSGILNVDVKARLSGENEERHGVTSIPVVQTKSYNLVQLMAATVQFPPQLVGPNLKSVQLYEGASSWMAASASTQKKPDVVRLETEAHSFPAWDGKVYLRYKQADDPKGGYRYEVLTAMEANPRNASPTQ
jgi:hypothetical protein